MELVYLWVEKYKNIHKQGFNFSPRFECKYENNELTICDKKKNECNDNNYIENFFGENINVTAIVGKNGSGKSSILECIHQLFLYNELEKYSKYILVVKNKDITYQTNISKIDTNFTKCKIEKHDWYLYLSHNNKEIDETYERRHIISLEKNIIANKLANSLSSTQEFYLSSFMYLPNKVEIQPNLDQVLMNICADDFVLNYIPSNIDNKIKEIEDNKYKKDKEEDSEGVDLLNEIEMSNILKNADELHKFLIFLFNFYYHKEILEDKEKLIKIYEKYNFKLSKEKLNFFLKKRTISLSEISKEESKFYFLDYHKLFTFDFIDSKKRRYNHLSHGEKVIFGTLLNIYNSSLDLENKNMANPFNIKGLGYSTSYILDEPDISLHPNWQKKYIREIINLLQKCEGYYHIILTSHSPFLLSDIPKQNIIFLDTYKENDEEVKSEKQKNGNCKVVDGLKEKKQTFGANIHTLLSDSFFMEDGLMGEFAKGKINEIIDFYKLVKKNRHTDCLTKIYLHSKQKKFWQTQKIIGEEYLKQVVKNHLLEIEKILLKDKAKQEEIKRVEAYLESLKK